MVTPEQIDAQIQLERQAIEYGLERLRQNTSDLENKNYASATAYGTSSVRTALPKVAEQISNTASRIRNGKAGPHYREIVPVIECIEPEVAASLALKVTFDCVFSPREKLTLIQGVTLAIGSALEQESQIRWYEQEVPETMEYIKKKYWHASCGTANKVKLSHMLLKRRGVEWKKWPMVQKSGIGCWLLECVMTATGWFDRVYRLGKSYVDPSLDFLLIKEDLMASAELFSPMAWPMIIPPQEWGPDKAGGYLLNEVMVGHNLIRHGKGTVRPGAEPLAFLNKLQGVPYSLNKLVVGVGRELMERRIRVGKFTPILETPLPPKPHDIAENKESRQAYRREAAEAMNFNAAAFKRSCRTRMTMNTVDVFKDVEKFYLPWSFDYRGRVYPIPAFLTPQDTDFGKSLLKFAEPAQMTPEGAYWLAFHLATTYGLDKATMDERQAWAAQEQTRLMVSAIATDPLANLSEWEAAEEPWQFLAACQEYHECVIEKSRYWTNLPVAIDATCSGLQVLAGMARDHSTAQLVNVIPSDKPQDAYQVVADRAKTKLPEHLAALMDRKVTKRTVMTIPYNATKHSNRQYIKEALKDKNAEFTPEDLTLIVNAVRESMEEVVPGPMKVMDWIRDEVGKAFKREVDHLEWNTPSGFVVRQDRRKPNLVEVRTRIMGRCRFLVADGYKGPDVRGHKSSTAPNLIHSLDASLLHMAFLKFDKPFTVIHDSVLCRATDMGELNQTVRQTYYELFTENDPLREFANAIEAETEPPIIGDLDLSSVLSSTYFFC